MDLKRIAEEMQPRSMAARDWVFQVIRTAIVRGVLPGGMPLRQNEISAALSVSHIPVREAFRQLEAQGLVRIYPNRGAVVTKLTKEEIGSLMDIRIMLELGAIRAAIPMMNEEAIEEALAIHEEFSKQTDGNKLEDLNLQLHFAIYRPANNMELIRLIDQLHANVDRYIRPFYAINDSTEKVMEDHQKLIQACKARDAELATALLRTHLESTKVMLMTSPLFV